MMTVEDELRFDSDTLGAAPTWPAGWSHTGGNAPTVEAAAAAHGAAGCRYSTTGAFGRAQRDLGSNRTGITIWSGYFNIRTLSSANHTIAAIYSLTSGGSIQADWRRDTSGTVTLRDGTAAIATSIATLAAEIWYRFEHWLNDTLNTQELRIYVGESSTPHITLTGAFSGVVRVPVFGASVAATGGAIDYDTMKIADDWVGPEVPPTPPSLPPSEWRLEAGVWQPYLESLL